MRALTIAAALTMLFTVGCGSSRGGASTAQPTTAPGRGEITITVDPNPIVARSVSGDTYDFPFTVIIRENGGVAVNIDRVSVEVRALGAIQVYQQSYGPDQIRALGYPTGLAARSDLRYSFNPRKEVPDERLFGGVTAELRAEGTDANGNRVSARTNVTVRR